MAVVVWVHNLIYRLLFALLMLGVRSITRWVQVVFMLLGEEFRRYFGLALSGAVVMLLGKASLNYAPEPVKRWLVLAVLVMMAAWALAVRRAVRFTRHNNLIRVRQRQAFKDLATDVTGVRHDLTEGLAKATRNTPMKKAFRSNRKDIAKAEERTRQAEAEAEQRAAQEAFLDSLPPDHDPYARSRQ